MRFINLRKEDVLSVSPYILASAPHIRKLVPFHAAVYKKGVIKTARDMDGIARALELTALKAMKEMGCKYAISGMVHPRERLNEEMVCDLLPIPDSVGSYKDIIKTEK